MIQNGDQEMFVEFERMRKLFAHLPHTVDELQEHRRSISIWMMIVTVANSLLEFVAKAEPLLFDQYFEASHGAIVRIEQKHSQGGQLSGTIPAIGTVDHHRCAHYFDLKRRRNGLYRNE